MLNNRGWGLKEMLVLSSILIFFFCLAIYFIYIFYSSLTDGFKVNEDYINESIYLEIENNLEEAGLIYLENNYLDDDTFVDIDLLVEEGYVDEIIDPETDNKCSGYIKILDYKKSELEAYIKCDNYTSDNYQN